MCLDPEVVRVSGDGLKAVAKAAELMLGDMAAKACAAAQGQKRKTIKLSDIEQTGAVPELQSSLCGSNAACSFGSNASLPHPGLVMGCCKCSSSDRCKDV